MDLQLQPFSSINLDDPFFDSLKASYPEFVQWYSKKAVQGAEAYVFHDDQGLVTDFKDEADFLDYTQYSVFTTECSLLQLSDDLFNNIIALGKANERYFVD